MNFSACRKVIPKSGPCDVKNHIINAFELLSTIDVRTNTCAHAEHTYVFTFNIRYCACVQGLPLVLKSIKYMSYVVYVCVFQFSFCSTCACVRAWCEREKKIVASEVQPKKQVAEREKLPLVITSLPAACHHLTPSPLILPKDNRVRRSEANVINQPQQQEGWKLQTKQARSHRRDNRKTKTVPYRA